MQLSGLNIKITLWVLIKCHLISRLFLPGFASKLDQCNRAFRYIFRASLNWMPIIFMDQLGQLLTCIGKAIPIILRAVVVKVYVFNLVFPFWKRPINSRLEENRKLLIIPLVNSIFLNSTLFYLLRSYFKNFFDYNIKSPKY